MTSLEKRVCVFRRSLLVVSLFVVVLAFSLFTCDCYSSVSLENAVYVSNETELRNAINNAAKPTVIALEKDITLTDSSLTIPVNKDITLSSSKTVGYYKLIGAEGVSTIFVNGGSVLKLDGVIVTHVTDADKVGGGVYVETNGLLIMYSGEVSGNTAMGVWMPILGGSYSSYGGGVYNNGTFEMYGGKISGNKAAIGSGGGVFNKGTFKLFGGEISNNNATTISSVTDSDAWGYGGGVYNMGTFTMSGGKISGNTAQYGGGVYNTWVFDRSGGVISGNTALAYNDDVYSLDSGGSSNGSDGSGLGNGGGSSNGGGSGGNDNGSGSNGSGESTIGSGFSLRVIVLIFVIVVSVVVCVLFFYFKKKITQMEAKFNAISQGNLEV